MQYILISKNMYIDIEINKYRGKKKIQKNQEKHQLIFTYNY